MPFLFDGFIPCKLNISVQFFNALQTLVMINQGGERICAGFLEKKDRLTHLNFRFCFIRNLKFKDGTII